MRMQITFRSGAQIEVDADEFRTERNALGELMSLTWTTPDRWARKLHTITDLTEIVAIVAVNLAVNP